MSLNMKPLLCFSVSLFLMVSSTASFADAKMRFDSQSAIEIHKIQKKPVWQKNAMQKDLKKLSKKVSDLGELEQARVAKLNNKDPQVLQVADKKVGNKIQDIAGFLQSSSIAKSDPDFTHAFLIRLSGVNKARREQKTQEEVSVFTAGKSSKPKRSPQDQIKEMQALLDKQDSFVSRI